MLQVVPFTFNAFSENTYLLIDEATREAALVDPGMYARTEQDTLSRYVQDNKLTIKYILLTHAHIDHVLGNAFALRQYPGTPLLLHAADWPTLRAVASYAGPYGFAQYEASEPTGELVPGQVIELGESCLQVRFAPGHAPGHVVLYDEAGGQVIGGDVLFQGSVGRTDLPGGNHPQLLESIRRELLTLPDATVVYPGHGPATTVGAERRSNPFLR